MRNDFLAADEIDALGFHSVGVDVRISRLAIFYNPAKISLGDHVRIDAFSLISAAEAVDIGSYTHIGAGCYVFGTAGCRIGDFVSLSPRSAIFTTNDDFSGRSLVGPMVPDQYRAHLTCEPVTFEDYACLATNATVLPGVTFYEGSVAAAHALVTADCDAWTIYGGVPASVLRERRRDCREYGAECLQGVGE